MNIERMPAPIGALIIKGALGEGELGLVRSEAKRLLRNDDGVGVWLNEAYEDLDESPAHRSVMEGLFQPDVLESLFNLNSLYGLYGHVNNHSTIVRYYGEGQSSILHFDSAAFTVMTFLCDEPKNFTGGEVTLQVGGDSAYEYPVEDNTTIIFPSSYYVGISEVGIKDRQIEDSGLYVVTSYLFIDAR